jgi:hypothetical protein
LLWPNGSSFPPAHSQQRYRTSSFPPAHSPQRYQTSSAHKIGTVNPSFGAWLTPRRLKTPDARSRRRASATTTLRHSTLGRPADSSGAIVSGFEHLPQEELSRKTERIRGLCGEGRLAVAYRGRSGAVRRGGATRLRLADVVRVAMMRGAGGKRDRPPHRSRRAGSSNQSRLE